MRSLIPLAALPLKAVATLAFAVAAAAFMTGGFEVDVLGLSIHDPWRPFIVGAICLAILLSVGRRLHSPSQVVSSLGGWLVFGVAAYVALVIAFQGSFVAAAADASGYVSQSELWTEGTLHVRQPLADRVSWPNREWTFSPLGYRPATIPGHMVPTYAPGLPLMMALARTIGGQHALYLVVPLSGLLLLLATFGLGFELGGTLAGALAVTLIALSPTFLYMVLQPMSDVPAGAFWATALLLAWRARHPRGALVAGLVAAVAVTIRPNLVPLAAVIGAAVLLRNREHWLPRIGAFVLGLLPGALVVGLIQWQLYGSPVASGYGQLGPLFDLANIPPNLAHYGSWLLHDEWPIVGLGLLGAVTARSSQPSHLSRLVVLLFLINLALYLAYLRFDEWTYLRFLLPGLAVLSACAGACAARVIERLPPRLAPAAAVVLVGVSLAYARSQANALDVFVSKRLMNRFVQTAAYVNRALPADAVLFCMEHSGSLRYYTHRTVVRYDYMQEAWLDRAVAELQALGKPVYFVLDDAELYKVRERFAGRSTVGLVDWPPEMIVRAPGRVAILRVP
jgi:hypothetical protein